MAGLNYVFGSEILLYVIQRQNLLSSMMIAELKGYTDDADMQAEVLKDIKEKYGRFVVDSTTIHYSL